MVEDIITYADDVSLDSQSRDPLETFASWWEERRNPESDLPYPNVVDIRSYLLHPRLKGTGRASAVETEYRVWWQELGSGGWTHVTTGLDANGTSYAISGVSPSTTYEVTVLAHNLQGDSENNPVISFLTPGAISNPSSPTADFDGDGSVGFSDFLLFAEGFGRSAGDEG